MPEIDCPTCGCGKVKIPDPITDHVCDKYCGNLHFRYSHAMWKNCDGHWEKPMQIMSMNKDKKYPEYSLNLVRGSWPCLTEEKLRDQFKLIERKTSAVVEGAAINLKP